MRSSGWLVSVWCAVLVFAAIPSPGAEPKEAMEKFLRGEYENTVKLAQAAIQRGDRNEEWQHLLLESLLTQGRYREAHAAFTNALPRHRSSIRLRLIGHQVLLFNGQSLEAKRLLLEINSLAGARMWAYNDPPNWVALGRTALTLGADPRVVLDNFFDRAKKTDPGYRESYLASAELALEKHDYDLASKVFSEALKRFPKDPDFHFGLARAYAPSNRKSMISALKAALAENPRHLPSLLLQTDHLIDAEEYEAAAELLDKIDKVNPAHPEAWAYRAILRHLDADYDAEKKAREKALAFWKDNPAVDHLIGKKISQKYRFREGSLYQRRALGLDSDFLPAKIQLAQDLLRLGEEEEGWKLAEEVYELDPYDVVAYNLATLHDSFKKFQTLTNEHFILRMQPLEAAVYGTNALALLEQARAVLAQKYGLELQQPTIVEIFPDQKDFAIRTFALPGGEEFLGVCFGRVITANSPVAMRAHPSNWKAILWHEFCHVITLTATRNKMPRWLSEGISVYEERLANAAWGQRMNPRYRKMILDDELVPVGELSSAFLAPQSDLHLQFAYFESAMVVEFLVTRHGVDPLKRLLTQLGTGLSINDALEQQYGSLDTLEKEFAKFARDQAEQLAPQVDWKQPELSEQEETGFWERWLEKHPQNFWGLTQRGKELIAQKKWADAKAPLLKLLEIYPDYQGQDNPYELLAEAHQGLGETEQERRMLSRLAEIKADALDPLLRLLELDVQAKDWKAAHRTAERILAIDPLLPQPHRHLASAHLELGERPRALSALRTLLLLDPPDRPEVQFRLATLLHETGDPHAKKHLLQALEEAPRFRAGYKLLQKMSEKPKAPPN